MHFFAFGVIIIIIIIISVVTFFMLSVSILLLSLLISSLNIKLFIIIEIFWFGHNQRVFRRSPEVCLTFRLSDQVHGSSKNWLLRRSTLTPFLLFPHPLECMEYCDIWYLCMKVVLFWICVWRLFTVCHRKEEEYMSAGTLVPTALWTESTPSWLSRLSFLSSTQSSMLPFLKVTIQNHSYAQVKRLSKHIF